MVHFHFGELWQLSRDWDRALHSFRLGIELGKQMSQDDCQTSCLEQIWNVYREIGCPGEALNAMDELHRLKVQQIRRRAQI